MLWVAHSTHATVDDRAAMMCHLATLGDVGVLRCCCQLPDPLPLPAPRSSISATNSSSFTVPPPCRPQSRKAATALDPTGSVRCHSVCHSTKDPGARVASRRPSRKAMEDLCLQYAATAMVTLNPRSIAPEKFRSPDHVNGTSVAHVKNVEPAPGRPPLSSGCWFRTTRHLP